MPEVLTYSVDARRLNAVINETVRHLPTTVEDEIRKHTRLAAGELAKASDPKNRDKAAKKIEFATRKNFYPLPNPNMIGVGRKSTAGGTLWLYASPRFLVGIDRSKYAIAFNYSAQDLAKNISANRHKKGRTWLSAGNRGNQKVMIVQKPVAQPERLNEATRIVQGQIGKAKATWIKAAADLGLDAKADGWVMRHKQNARGRGTQEGTPQSGKFTLVLTSTVPARMGQRHQDVANRVMKGRAAKAAADLRNQMNGLYKKAGWH